MQSVLVLLYRIVFCFADIDKSLVKYMKSLYTISFYDQGSPEGSLSICFALVMPKIVL